ncbi:hypothetical protein L596_017106 [Steinernema carpocapsae]|uniref:Uncharacterized protein n=1 Tax=Steinernema carpocapsae TaxID=34508 RepID=A0A4U5N1F0_STECR|nr:hypothetical protein L596_017106 [Steinernema carpocapsae]
MCTSVYRSFCSMNLGRGETSMSMNVRACLRSSRVVPLHHCNDIAKCFFVFSTSFRGVSSSCERRIACREEEEKR